MQKKILSSLMFLGLGLTLLLSACGGKPATQATAEVTSRTNPPEVESTESAVQESGPSSTVKLNLNEATGDEFMQVIPAFSNRMVREFLEYRPYISIQQFRREIGKYVSDDQVAEYELYVFVPVDINNSDLETMMQLPGVDETIAGELIAGRPYASTAEFLEKLSSFVSDGDAKQAGSYLATN